MAKNTHLEHLEDEIINKGVQGAKQAIGMLEELGNMLSADTDSTLKITTKFDGAPAVICGTDPSDGKFFVGTKSVFAKTEPKVMKSVQQIQQTYGAQQGLAEKLIAALNYLPSCQIKGVLQGDLMFTNDKQTKYIDGRNFITFTPNTLTYAAPSDSDLGRQIQSARLGIIFHTKYTGPSLAEMSASFQINKGDFQSSPTVWAQKAEFKNIGGAANFTRNEKTEFKKAINMARGSLYKSGNMLNEIQSGKKTLAVDTELKIFFNRYVKTGSLPTVDRAYRQFFYHLGKQYSIPIDKMKTLKGQADKAGKFMQTADYLMDHKNEVKMVIATYLNLEKAKMMVVKKLSSIQSLGTFVRQANGDFKTTAPEGFVAIGTKGAVKLVDRLEFSRLNFTIPKSFGR